MNGKTHSAASAGSLPIDRRGLMKAAFAGAVLVGLPAKLMAKDISPQLFIYDGRFPQALAAAKEWQGRGVAVLDSQAQDLGHAWREAIPKALAHGGGIAGMTLWVDSFVCETFGRDHKLAMNRVAVGGADGGNLQHWMLA